MGHQRLGDIPKSQRWTTVVAVAAASSPSTTAASPAWQMTRGKYQEHMKTQGHTNVTENNRTYWREVEAAIQSGKPVPANVLAEYKQLRNTRQE